MTPVCPHERQVYFDQTLPCARPGCVGYDYELATVIVEDRPEPDFGRYVVRVIFHTDGERWITGQCIDRYVDANLTDRLINAGLAGALVT